MHFSLVDSSGRVVVPNLEIARTLSQQVVGLLKHSSLHHDSGMWLEPCNGVHTFGMRFCIDVVYLDKEGRVLKVKANVAPNRICLPVRTTRAILEIEAGTAQTKAILVGKRYAIRETQTIP